MKKIEVRLITHHINGCNQRIVAGLQLKTTKAYITRSHSEIGSLIVTR